MLKQLKVLGLVTVMSLGLNMVGCTDVEDTNTSEPVKQEQHLEENKIDNKEEVKEEKREEVKKEMAQCYDCGQYKPIKDMSFNGRSYHCGCANKCCLYCKQEIPYGKEICVDDTLYFCEACYSEYEEEHNYVTDNCILCAKMTLLDADTMLCDQCKDFAQCYDCGEYKNMNYMVFDGNKYHCGCAEEALVHCDRCGKEVDVNDTVNYGEGERYCYPCNEEQLKEEGLYINLGN